jgi:hypothetical protein
VYIEHLQHVPVGHKLLEDNFKRRHWRMGFTSFRSMKSSGTKPFASLANLHAYVGYATFHVQNRLPVLFCPNTEGADQPDASDVQAKFFRHYILCGSQTGER